MRTGFNLHFLTNTHSEKKVSNGISQHYGKHTKEVEISEK